MVVAGILSTSMDDVEMPIPVQLEADTPQDNAVQQQFDALYMAKLLDKLRHDDKKPEAAAEELQDALRKLHALQQIFVTKQAKQNLLDRLAQIETLEALQKAAASRKAQVEVGYSQEKKELQTAVAERGDALRLLERLADEVEQQKLKVLEHEQSRQAHETELAQLNEVWKAMQKKDARRKAAVQVATGVMITDEEDCGRVLDLQTRSIQEMHQKQKQLEDEKIDISTQVKRAKRKIEDVTKQNDLRSKDAEVKQREQDYMTLQQMKRWYDHVRNVNESLVGIEITNVIDDYLEVRILRSRTVRLYCDPEITRLQRVQLLTPDVAAADLVEVAVRENNIQYFLCEYRERVREQLSL
ncbi:hypothetical protein P3T76_006831 [Phytophthora citrophthora]|uniref:Uncharacterized protein n=1 Tax=Phytophthora citrophthora TaxID=4793 RepID=A0AAD9LNG2_9STRA|nr:hypothetical protein P3T76_006831 [Phytophthora citrophthora]